MTQRSRLASLCHFPAVLGVVALGALVVAGAACGAPVKPRKDGRVPIVSDAAIVVMAPTTSSKGPPGSGAPSDLVVMNLDGTRREQITHDDALEFLPHFSPDATKVLYTKFAQGTYGSANARFDAAVYDFTTKKETLLTTSGDVMQPVWSPDGSTIAFLKHVSDGAFGKTELWLMDDDGNNPRFITSSAGGPDDATWGDPAWSSDDWILFAHAYGLGGGCFKTGLDKIRPDGSEHTVVSMGGDACTPAGFEQSGDADPGFSADGAIIYTSRGLPRTPAGIPMPSSSSSSPSPSPSNAGVLVPTERKLVALSSDPWTPSKVERDLSLPSEPDCIEGVPKGSPDGQRVLEFRMCFDRPDFRPGVYVADADGKTRAFVADGFGPDWNPTVDAPSAP